MKKFALGLFLLSLAVLEGRQSVEFPNGAPSSDIEPWLTGPLLTPSAQVVPAGHVNFEPYVYWFQFRNDYNQHWSSHSIPHFKTILSQNFILIGVYKDLEFGMTPQFSYNNTQGEKMWRMLDFPFSLSYQLYAKANSPHVPKLKLRMTSRIPCGKYDRLSAHKLGTDVGGTGSWYPSIGLVFSELFHFSGVHHLATRLWVDYGFGAPTHIHGISVYGGTPDTKGTAYPGNILSAFAAFEYSFTQECAFAMDIGYVHTNKSRFSGKKGDSLPPKHPSSEQFSIAPAVEYNFSSEIGIIAGPWIVLAGRNTTQFVSWIAAVNFYF